MSAPSFQYLASSWDLTASGWDAGHAQFIDQSGLGLHLPLSSGSTLFATRGVISNALSLDTTQYYECQFPALIDYTVIATIISNISNNDTLSAFSSSENRGSLPNDHACTTWADPWATLPRGRLIVWYDSTINYLNANSGYQSPYLSVTRNQWSIVTLSVTKDGHRKIQKNDGSAVQNAPEGETTLSIAKAMRVGYDATNKPFMTDGGYVSLGEMHFIADDAFANQATALSAFIASLKTKYGI